LDWPKAPLMSFTLRIDAPGFDLRHDVYSPGVWHCLQSGR
jgi:hypothetical protein